MTDEENEITIEIPNDIIKKLKMSDNIPDHIKIQIARRLSNNKTKVEAKRSQVTPQNDNAGLEEIDTSPISIIDKIQSIFVILKDRVNNDINTSREEMRQLTEIIDNKEYNLFMTKLGMYAKQKGYKLCKVKSKANQYYKLVE